MLRTFLKIGLLLVLVSLNGCHAVKTPPSQTKTPTRTLSRDSAIQPIELAEQVIVVRAFWEDMQGLDLEQLFHIPALKECFETIAPSEPERKYSAEDFTLFLPPGEAKLGQVWPLPEEVVETFLSQFHEEVLAKMNFDGSGAYATIASISEERIEILFRMHAQFLYPENTYLSPAQFNGRLIVNSKTKLVEYFRVTVPVHHIKNVAFEVRSGDNLSGLTFVRRMELLHGELDWPASLKWVARDEPKGVFEKLGKQFFPCEEVGWMTPAQAWQTSRETGKPIFAIVIEGALTDQSC